MSDQPEALRLADDLDNEGAYYPVDKAAAELRRQHAEIEALKAERDALKAQRRPLTDTQIMAASVWCGHPIEVARAIEKAHGIGGDT